MAYKAIIDEIKCVSCGACEPVCPVQAIAIDEKAEVDNEKCVGCSACVPACPEEAIRMGELSGKSGSSPANSDATGASDCSSCMDCRPVSHQGAGSGRNTTAGTGCDNTKAIITAAAVFAILLFLWILDLFYAD